MLPAGTEIMSFFGGRGGDNLADMHGNFTGAPSARGGGRGRIRHTRTNAVVSMHGDALTCNVIG